MWALVAPFLGAHRTLGSVCRWFVGLYMPVSWCAFCKRSSHLGLSLQVVCWFELAFKLVGLLRVFVARRAQLVGGLLVCTCL